MEGELEKGEKDFEIWLRNKGQVAGLHFLWACHGLRSLVHSEDGNNFSSTSARLVESVYRQWIISGELEVSNHVLRSTIGLLLPLCRPDNSPANFLDGHLRVLRNIEGHVHSHIQSVLLPQFQHGNTQEKMITKTKSEAGVIINGEDGLYPTQPKRPPPPPLMKQEEFMEEVVSRLEALDLKQFLTIRKKCNNGTE